MRAPALLLLRRQPHAHRVAPVRLRWLALLVHAARFVCASSLPPPFSCRTYFESRPVCNTPAGYCTGDPKGRYKGAIGYIGTFGLLGKRMGTTAGCRDTALRAPAAWGATGQLACMCRRIHKQCQRS